MANTIQHCLFEGQVHNFFINEGISEIAQMFKLRKKMYCVIKLSLTSTVKVTVGGQRITWPVIGYILCPVYNVFIDQDILK
jgi:hypothetical protein